MVRGSSHLVAAWKLLRFDPGTGSLVPPLQGTELTAVFQDDGRLVGSAECNSYATTYEASSSSLTVNSLVAATRMWCADSEGAMAQEDAFLQAWGRVTAYGIHENRLELAYAKGITVLDFILAETPERNAE
ncbi:MAG: META domain-containing protein [Candidatus Thermoplasmatota archaeon]|nr:META domain-containing protein [Candidatus Thermoplasmatota archaeon]